MANRGSDIVFKSQHPGSKRWAIMEDDGYAAYLYLSKPGTMEPFRDAWVYNRIAAPARDEIDKFLGGPPPACQGYAGDKAVYVPAQPEAITVRWSKSGDAAAVVIDGTPTAFVVARLHDGYCRNVCRPGPWGMPWDEELFQREFGSS